MIAFLKKLCFSLDLNVKNVSADRMLASNEFQTTGAAAEKASEEKTVPTCCLCSNGEEFERKHRVGQYSLRYVGYQDCLARRVIVAILKVISCSIASKRYESTGSKLSGACPDYCCPLIGLTCGLGWVDCAKRRPTTILWELY